MRVNKNKLDIALAMACKSASDLRSEGLSPQTITRIRRGKEVKPVTVGKLAKALGVEVTDIIEEGE
ncbi:helix-turn-helix domain-containing protein [Listeria ivanovii]|uniref:helix-turn-helix domain-containing protein n=1 Tax=Listeria ivanovii TaxID=1638 RepID=UPI00162A8A7D|nr:helix-turn-helix domain-containing protein [Listeria ivanovii]MBC1758737.1 helix-turn-helix transcriptional regulator [Listeria ivanovii]